MGTGFAKVAGTGAANSLSGGVDGACVSGRGDLPKNKHGPYQAQSGPQPPHVSTHRTPEKIPDENHIKTNEKGDLKPPFFKPQKTFV